MDRRVVEQAGGVVFRRVDGQPEILIVRSRKSPDQWIFPKGHVDRGESAEETAVRETREEAGVVGEAVRPLEPAIEFDWRGDRIRVRYFLVRATGETTPSERREKKWCRPDIALRELSHETARDLLRRALQTAPLSPPARRESP